MPNFNIINHLYRWVNICLFISVICFWTGIFFVFITLFLHNTLICVSHQI